MVAQPIQAPVEYGTKNDPSRSPTGPYGHGSQGLFSLAGQDPKVFSAVILPISGMMGELPVVNGADDVPDGEFGGVNTSFFTTITGVTAGDADDFSKQPTEDCADGALAGLMKVCTLISTYARFRFSPNPISLFRAGQLRDIADPTYLQLMNTPDMAGLFLPTVPGGNILINEFARRVYEMRASMLRMLSQRLYVGSPANNVGQRRDFTGFDLQINTGNKIDAISGNICTAMNSVMEDFNYNIISGSGNDIVNYVDSVAYQLTFNSRMMGLDPVRWVIAMRPELFNEIVKVWPVRYYQEALVQIAAFTNGRVVLDGKDTTAMRDDMRQRSFLPIRGVEWEVVTDFGMTENTPNQTTKLLPGQYSSDIYFIPMTVLGGVPVTYLKYFNQANGNAQSIVQAMNIQTTFTSDAGVFRWFVNTKNGCIDLTVDFAPRLILRTPQIAARVQNVGYQPLVHTRSPYPSDVGGYWVDGGRTNDPQFPTFYQFDAVTPVDPGVPNRG